LDEIAVLLADREAPVVGLDDELALAARTDPEAFGLLYRRHRLSVYRYLRSRTSSDDDAIELTATTFERALVAMPRYRPRGGGVVAWLLRIARNAAIDAGRRTSVIPLDTDVVDHRPEASPEGVAMTNEDRRALAGALAALPEPQREAVILRYGAGLTARQIGEVLGKSDVATQKLLGRALASIREHYRDDS
jgi:RNA polymerase sigma-70 factor (ECF subfamily)